MDLAEAAAEVSDALQSEALDSAVRAASVERSLRLAAESAAATAQQVPTFASQYYPWLLTRNRWSLCVCLPSQVAVGWR